MRTVSKDLEPYVVHSNPIGFDGTRESSLPEELIRFYNCEWSKKNYNFKGLSKIAKFFLNEWKDINMY